MPARKNDQRKRAPRRRKSNRGEAMVAAAPTNWRARIRMYRQGLGDCFLLTFGDTQPRHLLIDCGVILGTPDPAGALRPVAEDIFKETEGKIDTLVITHEHLDHLWGFHEKTAGDIFDRITFDRLWMAWTEDPKDVLATELRKSRIQMEEVALHAAARLSEAGARKGIDRGSEERLRGMAQRIEDVLGFRGIEAEQIASAKKAPGAKKRAKRPTATTTAFDHLKQRISEKSYFRPGTGPFPLPNVDDVRFYVLGPPRSAAQLHKSAVNKSDDVFKMGAGTLSMADSLLAAFATHEGGTDTTTAELGHPFESTYRVRSGAAEVAALRRAIGFDDAKNAWRQIEDDWLATGEQLALNLDSDTNNTSLVLAFEFVKSAEVLLFVADAQLGNWYSWEEYTWDTRNSHGEVEKLTAADLLRRAIFYKVGHHGSHNATLRTKGVERMTSGNLVAMMPVDERVAHDIKRWMRMPLPSLCDWLEEKCACFIRLDKAEDAHGQLNGRVQTTKLFVDYFV